jgi:hypothetical protein
MDLKIVVTITWKEEWLNKFIENLDRVKDSNKTTNRTIDVVKNPNRIGVFDNRTTLYINDKKIYDTVYDAVFRPIYQVVEVMDRKGRWIIRGCEPYPRYEAVGDVIPHTIYANFTIPKEDSVFNEMKDMDHVNVYMVTSCSLQN